MEGPTNEAGYAQLLLTPYIITIAVIMSACHRGHILFSELYDVKSWD